MINKRLSIISLIVIVALITAVLSVGAFSPQSGSTGGTFLVRAAVPADCSGTPWFVAQQKGYFERHNISLADQGSLDWTLQGVALGAGQIDVIDANPSAIINLLISGAKIHAVALSALSTDSDNETTGQMHWMVKQNSTFGTVQDLVKNGNKPKIGVAVPGFCMKLEESGWYRANNITMGSFEYVTIPDPQLEEALRHGQIDVAIMPESFYTVVEQHGGLRSISTSIDPYAAIAEMTFLVFTDDYVRKSPDGVREFVKAFRQAEIWSNEHPDESCNITAAKLAITDVPAHRFSDTGRITDDMIQPWIDAMVTDGTIAKDQFVPSDLYTTEFDDTW